MERAVIGGERVGKMCGVSGGWWGGGGGMWSRHTFSLTRLEPTRTVRVSGLLGQGWIVWWG